MIQSVSGPPSSGSRILPRDVLELKALAERQPALAPAATLQVDSVALDRTRWRIVSASGTGTVATTLSTPCNPGDVLGTSTSQTTVTAG